MGLWCCSPWFSFVSFLSSKHISLSLSFFPSLSLLLGLSISLNSSAPPQHHCSWLSLTGRRSGGVWGKSGDLLVSPWPHASLLSRTPPFSSLISACFLTVSFCSYIFLVLLFECASFSDEVILERDAVTFARLGHRSKLTLTLNMN